MKKILCLMFVIVTNVAFAKISFNSSLDFLVKNINPTDTVSGIVVASPSRSHPNYFYHWVRDAALVMSTITDVALQESSSTKKSKLYDLIFKYVTRVKANQRASGFSNYGEPKYNVDGSPYTGPWGRPQHDGPALRAITLMKLANIMLDQGNDTYVRQELYSFVTSDRSPITEDLLYVTQHWNEQGFDYWEEVMGLHFSNAMVQRKALKMGIDLAIRLGDHSSISLYKEKIIEIETLIEKFWSSDKDYIQATLFQTRGVYKSHLDISVILGVLHGETGDDFYSVSDALVLRTATKIEETFKSLYKINKKSPYSLGTAIGRYPEDTYNGYDTDGVGHAWFLATFAMAEFHLRLANKLETNFELSDTEFYCKLISLADCTNIYESPITYKAQIITTLKTKANSFFKRAEHHSGKDGHMSEQMNRYSGYMEGARDLTWSYAAHISALLQLK